VRGLGCDLAVDFHGNLRSGIVTRWTGARVRVGHDTHQQKEGNRYCTTHRVDPGPDRRRSRIERHLALVGALGVPVDVLPDAGFRPTKDEIDAARDVARAAGAGPGRPYAVINPGASKAQRYKQPPAELLAGAANTLAARGLVPLILHGPGEREDAESVASLSGPEARVAQPTPLRVLIPLLRGARLFVGGDSGPLHLACGVGCPVVGLYGPTDPAVNAPWNVPSRIVHPAGRTYTGVKRSDRAAGGFEGLQPEAVRKAIDDLLEGARAGA
jgi:ADP-heptose:LPS heptosyltransferase